MLSLYILIITEQNYFNSTRKIEKEDAQPAGICRQTSSDFYIFKFTGYTMEMWKSFATLHTANSISQSCKIFISNALQRAISISTLPRKTPCKYWLFQSFFAGNYQKILKKGFLKMFLVLFIICSYFLTNNTLHIDIIPLTQSSVNAISLF